MPLLTALLAPLLSLAAQAGAPDLAAYQAVLDAHVDARSTVDYAGLEASGALEPVVASFATATEPTAAADKAAFWINAYNALTLDLISDSWPLASIRDLDGGDPWNKRTFTVAGRAVTLNDIEHKILRPMGDARVHAAVNCASRGCPPLPTRAFTGAALEAQLDAASRAWAATNGAVVDRAAKRVQLSMIFDWYGEDFLGRADQPVPGLKGKQAAAIDFLADHASADLASFLRSGDYSVSWAPYDWKVNQR